MTGKRERGELTNLYMLIVQPRMYLHNRIISSKFVTSDKESNFSFFRIDLVDKGYRGHSEMKELPLYRGK